MTIRFARFDFLWSARLLTYGVPAALLAYARHFQNTTSSTRCACHEGENKHIDLQNWKPYGLRCLTTLRTPCTRSLRPQIIIVQNLNYCVCNIKKSDRVILS